MEDQVQGSRPAADAPKVTASRSMMMAVTSRRARPEVLNSTAIPSFTMTVLIVVGVGLVLPCGFVEVSASLARLLFPLYVLGFGLMLQKRCRPLYPAFCLAVFAFSPLLRRIADYHAGFSTFSPILLAPYIVSLPCVLPLLRQALRPERSWMFIAMLGCFAYACFMALFQDHVAQALYEPLRWVVPIGLCAFIMERPKLAYVTHRGAVHALAIIVLILSVYGVAQYYDPRPWDRTWMMNVHNPTFGQPLPFRIRVFSMMNSPASAANFTSAALLLLSGESGLAFLVAIAGVPLVALTAVRSAWWSLAVGLVVMLAMAPWRRKVRLTVFLLSGTLLASGLLASRETLPNELRYFINDRLYTMMNLSTDRSADDRLTTYSQFYSRLADRPFGEGFGVNSSTISDFAKQNRPVLDSAIMESFLTFGLIGGLVYFFAMGGFLVAGYRACRAGGGRLAACLAAFYAMLAGMPLGTTQIGEVSIVAWTCMGLLLAYADFKRSHTSSMSAIR
jgi:hypothetical protein